MARLFMLTRKTAIAAAAFFATLAILSACTDQSVTAPLRPPSHPARDGAALYLASLGVSETNDVNNGTFGPVPAGIIIPARARFIVRVTGSLTVTPNPNLTCEVVSGFPCSGSAKTDL